MYILKNLMEDAVLNMSEDLMSNQEMCKCEQCRLDVAAIALNALPPRYVVSTKGASYARADLLEIQRYVDLVGSITKAIKLVKEHPRH